MFQSALMKLGHHGFQSKVSKKKKEAILGLTFQDFWRSVWCKQTIGDFQVLSKQQLRIIVHVFKDLVIKMKLLNPINKELLE